jgi:fermentation-respiration switch protein FrsA (DUF1100 family)
MKKVLFAAYYYYFLPLPTEKVKVICAGNISLDGKKNGTYRAGHGITARLLCIVKKGGYIMIAVLRDGATEQQIENLCAWFGAKGWTFTFQRANSAPSRPDRGHKFGDTELLEGWTSSSR